MMNSNDKYPCPVCGSMTIDSPRNFDVCDVCGWEDVDAYRDFPDERFFGDMSLNEARKIWAEGKPLDPRWPHP